MKPSFTALAICVLCAFISDSHADSPDCTKEFSLVETIICSDPILSDLDASLKKAYEKAMANTTERDALKNEQKSWFLNVRNKCQDAACLIRVYNEWLTALNRISASNTSTPMKEFKDIVPGRCHMNSCWWWKVEKTEDIKSERNGKLVKVYARTTWQEYSDVEIDKHGYPNFPPENSNWEGISELFVFCSNRLPTYIMYNEEKKKFLGTIPFDQTGFSSGATEGIGNLYFYICDDAKESTFEISADLRFSEIIIDKPTDIFDYTH